MLLTQSFLALLGAAVLVQSTPLDSQHSLQMPLDPENAAGLFCNCSGTHDKLPINYICGDSRLGPVRMPRRFPLLGVIGSYDRLGGHSPGKFLELWTDSKTGEWVWPPQNGFLLDNNDKPILANTTIQVGTRLDRFGSPYGSYLAAADAPFSQRALPPNSLDSDSKFPDWPFNYHVYEVIKPLPLLSGLIAPWFGQPGLGSQFWTGYLGNVQFLLDSGYLKEQEKSLLPIPGRIGGRCG